MFYYFFCVFGALTRHPSIAKKDALPFTLTVIPCITVVGISFCTVFIARTPRVGFYRCELCLKCMSTLPKHRRRRNVSSELTTIRISSAQGHFK